MLPKPLPCLHGDSLLHLELGSVNSILLLLPWKASECNYGDDDVAGTMAALGAEGRVDWVRGCFQTASDLVYSFI